MNGKIEQLTYIRDTYTYSFNRKIKKFVKKKEITNRRA